MALAAPFPAARAPRPRAARTTGLRLTARGRAVLLLASVAFLLLTILASGRFVADAGSAPGTRPASDVVVVQPGETLWQIAQAVSPGSDPRELVALIRELNGLGTGSVRPGQSLVVPR